VSSLKAVQDAIFGVLHGDATLLALAPVYNDVPDGTAYPYVEIGTATERPWHTLGGATSGIGWNATVTVHIWSRYQGDLEALNILTRVTALLNFATLAVTGFTTALCEADQVKVLVEQVEKVETRHVAAIFRIRVHT
jgi:hypothetical protein